MMMNSLTHFSIKYLLGVHMRAIMLLPLLLALANTAYTQESPSIKLPPVNIPKDKPFSDAMWNRHSSREFSEMQLSIQDLSNVLWCANGINRPDDGHRTAPSARNAQDIDIFAVMKDGVYLYDATKNELLPVTLGDYRKDAGSQDYVATAPLNLVFVSDLTKLTFSDDKQLKLLTAAIDAGHCSQNVYLYGAVADLGVVVRLSFDKIKLAEILKLKPEQEIMIAQTVGYPKPVE
jgi:SagB-type dehydrogenase family enzyme